MPKRIEQPKFEQLYAELEAVVAKLESGNLSLDESLDLFQQGIELAKRCGELLDAAQVRIHELVPSADGAPDLVDLEA